MSISGFAFKGRGRLDRTETFETRNGAEIVTLVLQVEGTRPQLVPVKFFGRMAGDAKRVDKGATIEITGHLGGREWNGKVYGDIVGETMTVVVEGEKPKQQELPPPPPPDDDVPF